MSKRFILRLCVVSTLLFLFLGGVGLRSQVSQPTNAHNQDASVNTVTPIDPRISKYAVGDFDLDFKEEVAVDFGTAGIWLYDQGKWTQLAPENPESLISTDIMDRYGEITADFGSMGLWMWDHGTWSQISSADVESMATGKNYLGGGSSGQPVLYTDFGGLGLWMIWVNWNYVSSGTYIPEIMYAQISGANADQLIASQINPAHYFDYVIGDFGTLGIWEDSPWLGALANWTQTSTTDAEYITSGRWGLAVDFGALGLWQYHDPGGWTNLTGTDHDFMIPADTNGDFIDEIAVDFGAVGLWLWDGSLWSGISAENAEYMISAEVTGDGRDEIVVDFGALGLWVWNDGTWGQISTMDPEYILSADTNGDGAKEILADFGASGLWLWNGAWTQISEDNPD